jgi:hypothetical protein
LHYARPRDAVTFCGKSAPVRVRPRTPPRRYLREINRRRFEATFNSKVLAGAPSNSFGRTCPSIAQFLSRTLVVASLRRSIFSWIDLNRSRLMNLQSRAYASTPNVKEPYMAKTKTKPLTRKPYTNADVKLLKQHSKARTPIAKLAKLMKRSEGSLRQKALKLGIGLGHRR